MRKVSAHNREWCNVSVVVEGHGDAQAHFLRWLKRSTVPHLEVTGSALATLRKAGVVKARAPVGTLVLIDDIKTIARSYNSRGPKHRVADVLDGLVWNETVVLENPPPIRNAQDTSNEDQEAEPKKVKQEQPLTDGDEWLGFLDAQFVQSVIEEPMTQDITPKFALAHTSTWIVYSGVAADSSTTLQSPYQVQKIARSEDTTSILLPAMPPGVVSLVINQTTYFVTVVSEEVTNLLKGGLI